MSRQPVHVRDAAAEDAAALLQIWSEFARPGHADRPTTGGMRTDADTAVARIAEDPDQRLVVAVHGDTVIAAAHLFCAYVSPIHVESAVYVTHLHVLEEFRRHGAGKALIEAAVTWAEERGAGQVLSAASVQSRDANRFMARLGLAQFAILRGASVATLRARMPVEPPAAAMVTSRNHRSVGQVLAQRRSQRRARARSLT